MATSGFSEPFRVPRGITARSLKVRYETQVGRGVPASTVYRLLARHQWRRMSPRPKHPKDNPAARAALNLPDQCQSHD